MFFSHKHCHTLTLNILYHIDVWVIGQRFSLSDVFQGTYSLLLLHHLQFNPQKPCTVQQNRQNRNDGSKGRQTLLLSGHFCDFNSPPFRSIQCLLNTVSARYMILTSRAWVMWQSFYIPSHVMRHKV